MDTPQSSDRTASPGNSAGGNNYAQDDDASVLHADQLTGGTEAERRPMPAVTKWLLLALAAVVVIVGAFAVAGAMGGTSEQDVTSSFDVFSGQQEFEGGGTVDTSVSLAENAAVLTFNGVEASEGRTYQVWRLPLDGSAPVSAGTIKAEDITSSHPVVIEGIGMARELAVSVEAPGGAESPSQPFAVVIPTTTPR